MNLKSELDKSIPEHITLTEREKQNILMTAQKSGSVTERKISFKPLFVSVAMLFIVGMFLTPFIQQAFFSNLKAEKVIIAGADLDPLINSFYIDSINEIVFTDHNQIYTYSLDTKETHVLVEEKGSSPIWELAVTDKWVVWENILEARMKILNRSTNEISTVYTTIVGTSLITDDTLIYLPFRDNDVKRTYYKLDLNSLKETPIHTLVGEGSNSKPVAHDGKLVIPEYTQTEVGRKVTTYFVYDLQSNEKIGEYSIPYKDARNVVLTENRIYAQLTNDEGMENVLGYVDLNDGNFYELDVPSFWDYGIYENYVALSLPNDETNSAKLFEINGDEVKPLSTFNGVKERLVVPRFTDEGTLVVNGEGIDFPIYIVKTK